MLTTTTFWCNINVSISKTLLFTLEGGSIILYDYVIETMKRRVRLSDLVNIFKLFIPVIMMYMTSLIEQFV